MLANAILGMPLVLFSNSTVHDYSVGVPCALWMYAEEHWCQFGMHFSGLYTIIPFHFYRS